MVRVSRVIQKEFPKIISLMMTITATLKEASPGLTMQQTLSGHSGMLQMSGSQHGGREMHAE